MEDAAHAARLVAADDFGDVRGQFPEQRVAGHVLAGAEGPNLVADDAGLGLVAQADDVPLGLGLGQNRPRLRVRRLDRKSVV